MSEKYRLGLDVGTNSLGWAVIGLKEDVPSSVLATGVRIFSEGRDAKTKSTLKASRTEKRSARRRRDRFLQRQTFLISEMVKSGLFPKDIVEQKNLELLDPYEIRFKALTEQVPLHHLGRALFHINQRRGFKSSRKDKSEETTSGVVSKSVRALYEEMQLINPAPVIDDPKALSKEERREIRVQEASSREEALVTLAEQKGVTFGAFLYRRLQSGKSVRARKDADSQLYDVYPTRELLKDEYSKLMQHQAQYYPNVINEALISRLHDVIFFQRKLKEQERGFCTYYPSERRTFRCMPSFQQYRMVQELNALEWVDAAGKHCLRDYPESRDLILSELENISTKAGEFTFGNMKKILKKMGVIDGEVSFNFEGPKRKGFQGNVTSREMRHEDCFGTRWDELSLDEKDDIIDKINDDHLDDEDMERYLIDTYGLSSFSVGNAINARLLEGTANVSRKAARTLYETMLSANCLQSDAVIAVSEQDDTFVNPYSRTGRGELLSELPYYGEAFQDGRHIIPGKREPKVSHDQLKFYGGVSNPTVHIALNQIRLVVNEIIKRYGLPSSISIELARNLPEGQDGRRKIEKMQSENQKNNERYDQILTENGQSPNRDNRLRLALWEELGEGPTDRLCVFTGKLIELADLFNGSVEIEHLIPFSVSLDDSKANKTVCWKEANRFKGNKTPYEAFANNSGDYSWEEIMERVRALPNSKQWRFQEDALKIWNSDHSDFSGRHLNDTRYISRLAREYLENICPFNKIDVVTGRLTALLRGHWGLNNILRGHNEPETATPKKMRDDHRHHAIDAVVIAMTSLTILQKVSSAAGKAEELDVGKLFAKDESGRSVIDPWDGFRDEVAEKVRNIIVSHKTKRKTIGNSGKSTDRALHNETAYGLIDGPDEKGLYSVVTTKPISYFDNRDKIEKIRDEKLRDDFLTAWDGEGDNKASQLAVLDKASGLNVKKCRYVERKKVIPINGPDGQPYKAYDGNSNWGMEIYEFPNGHPKEKKWNGVVISTYDANKSEFKPGETFRPHPAAKLVMRLHINDIVEVQNDGEPILYRVQLISAGTLTVSPLHEANVDSRNRDKHDEFKYKSLSVTPMQKMGAKKVNISPTGLKNYSR
ncbi:NAD-dependent epimerase-dehydratase protein [Candidatus Micropelagos thuwalensis]|uniref:CRISPR-associated endonuclease Cas9 n=1 Tax=Candidatus Micropelagius thuwalensis TaxID=1397666 RepID=U2XW20_9PROT|nr:type II CRISPR RNA-guided endonuclease Cas9 [Candidatus Micropelagos thuwalensis]ERL47026.1 NAD-dependent epimerase-dehydratase protein [Candidatus Micropelagos thuwalensis]